MERIGFIGLGSIGAPMARRVIQAGYNVMVYDKNFQALDPFKKMGTPVGDKPADCADREMIIIMVANDLQVKEVVLGSDGIFSAVNPSRPPFIAVMSTILPRTTRSLAFECTKKNIRMVDATVSGSPPLAEKGKLSIMVGGEKTDFEAMRTVFRAMGENIYHTGPLGSGNLTKLINNIIGITIALLNVEVMLIGKNHGMDPYQLSTIFEGSSARNFFSNDWDKGRAYYKAFSKSLDLSKTWVDLARKDLEHAQELAREANVSCPVLIHIAEALKGFSYEDLQERWKSLA